MMETKPVFSGRMMAAILVIPWTLLAIVGAIKAYEDGIAAIVPGLVVALVLAGLTLLAWVAGRRTRRRTRYVLLGIVFLAMVALDAAVVYVFHLTERMVLISAWDAWLTAGLVAAVLYWRDRRNGPDVSAS